MITIKECFNGYEVTVNEEGDEHTHVFQTKTVEGDKQFEETIQELLDTVKRGIGVYGSKHQDYRVVIDVIKQNGKKEED